MGERVGLAVVLKKSHRHRVTANELVRSVRTSLANFKTPRDADVFFSDTTLPRGATGKILKRAIRKELNEKIEAAKTKSRL